MVFGPQRRLRFPDRLPLGRITTSGPAAFSQVVGSLLANTVYTLTGEVGHLWGMARRPAQFTPWNCWLGPTFWPRTPTRGPREPCPLLPGVQQHWSSYVGQALEILLSSNQPQTGFDAIALDASSVPCPTAILLGSGLMGLGLLRRKWSLKK